MTVDKEGKSSKKKIFVGIGIIAILLVMVGAIIIFSPQPAIYNGNMELTGSYLAGEYITFSANAGDIIKIEISNFESETSHSFLIHLYDKEGLVSVWSRSDNTNVVYSIEIAETGDYNLKFSVNTAGWGFGEPIPEVSFHLLVKKG